MAENYFGITDTGKRRDKNEDTFIAEVIADGLILACVIDGVGGYSGGEVAAEIARTTITEIFTNGGGNILEEMKKAIVTANTRIFKERLNGKNNDQMACVMTCSMADTSNNKFYYAHVGDTRLYLLRDKSLVKITTDHSLVGYLEESGRLTEAEAMRHPKRNEINKALGFEDHLPNDFIETGESPFLPGDMIMLCSDGLSDLIDNKNLTQILTSNENLKTKAQALVQAANDAGGKDNITVVLVENNKVATKHPATKPVSSVKNSIPAASIQEVQKKKASNVVTKKTNGTLIFILSILCIGLAVAYAFTFFKDKSVVEESNENKLLINTNNNPALLNILNASKNYSFTSTENPISVFDTIVINQDSLHITGNGITLKADSLYKGAGFLISGASRFILLDSLTLENFDVGILVQNNNVELKNVQFINCKIPIEYQFLLPDTASMNGRILDLFTSE